MKPLVSILIPAYNVENWIAETLESALAQTWLNKEIIIVDDGSKDNTLAVAKSFESPIVKVINQENQGQSAAENRAFQEAQGDLIEYLDSDDLLAPDKIERQVQLLGDGNSNFVATCEWARFYRCSQEALFLPQPPWADMSPIDFLTCLWENHYMMHGAAWLTPRKIVEQAGPWNEELSLINDFDFFSRIVLASQGVKFCWGARTYYRSGNSSSLSGSKSEAAWKSAFRSLELGTDNLLAREDSLRTRQVCATVFQRFIYEVYPDVPNLQQQAQEKVQQLGGSNEKPCGGPMFQLFSRTVGWQQAKRIQKLVQQYGYNKLALGWRLAQRLQKISFFYQSRAISRTRDLT